MRRRGDLPPHGPASMDEDRWSIATIRDLHTSKVLFEKEPVARLW